MNKFIKYGTIIGFAVILIGTGVTAAGYAVGARFYRIEELMEDRYHFGDGDNRYYYDDYGHTDYNHTDYGSASEYRESSGPEAAMETTAMNPLSNWQAGYPGLNDLKVHITGGRSFHIMVDDNAEEPTLYATGGSLSDTIYQEHDGKKKLTLHGRPDVDYTFVMPDGMVLDELEIELQNGQLTAENVSARETELKAYSGRLEFTQDYGRFLEIENHGAEIVWTGNGEAVPMIDVECQSGSVVVVMPEETTWEDYSYKLECDDGFIETPQISMQGFEKQRFSNDNTGNMVEIEAKSGGSAAIEFR